MKIVKTNDINYFKLICDDDEIFNFIHKRLIARDKNYFWNPLYKSGKWDGYIRFLNFRDKTFLSGLVMEVLKIAKDNKWKMEIDKDLIINKFKFTEEEIRNSLNNISLFDDQVDYIKNLLRMNKGLARLITSTGKTFLMIAIANLFYSKGIENIIFIVPKSTIGEQIYNDIVTKSKFIKKNDVGKLYDGNNEGDRKVVIATWQTLNSMLDVDKNYTKKFQMLIQDEVHVSSQDAKATKNVILSFSCLYKYGFSATIMSRKSNLLEYYNSVGMFGPILAKNSCKEMENNGRVSKIKIYCKVLSYKKSVEISSYKEYEDFIRYNKERRNYIFNLIKKIKEKNDKYNGLLLIRNIDFAMEFTELLKREFGDSVHFIDGEVKIEDREKIKEKIKKMNSQILVASSGCFTIGENVPNLHYLILLQIRKSEKEVIQGIGRLFRISEGKNEALIYDITDNIVVKEKKENGEIISKYFGKKHLNARLNVFKEYGLDVVDIENIKI